MYATTGLATEFCPSHKAVHRDKKEIISCHHINTIKRCFSRPNFVVLSSGNHLERVYYLPVESANFTNDPQ